jgi:hypothetical protein
LGSSTLLWVKLLTVLIDLSCLLILLSQTAYFFLSWSSGAASSAMAIDLGSQAVVLPGSLAWPLLLQFGLLSKSFQFLSCS